MSAENHHITDDLLVKYLLGETTPEEELYVQEWLAVSEANKKLLEHFKILLEQSNKKEYSTTINENEAWSRFQQRIPSVERDVPMKRSVDYSWLRIAALFIVIAGIGLMVFNFFPKKDKVQMLTVQAAAVTKLDTLPDGSIITLNKQSQITYASKFEEDNRTVTLKGEAFFNVTPDKKKPFIIQVADVTVKVVGTSFNIRSAGDKTEVIVETGVVEVMHNNQKVLLQPKEKIVVQKRDTLLAKEKVEDRLYNYYRSKEFVCDNTPLWKLVEVLNEAYDAHIEIGRKSLRNLPLNTTFNNESLDNILLVISQTFSISVERQGNTILLK